MGFLFSRNRNPRKQNHDTPTTWVSLNEPPKNIVRRNRFVPRTLRCLFFKSSDPVLIHRIDKDKTIDHNYHIGNCLKPVINEIWKQNESSVTKMYQIAS